MTVGRKSFTESTSGHYLQRKISTSFQGLERSGWLQSTCCPPLSFNLSLCCSVSLHPVPWLFTQWEMEQDWPLMTSSEWRAVHRSHCCARTLIMYWEHGHFTKENHLLLTHVSLSYTLHFGLLQLAKHFVLFWVCGGRNITAQNNDRTWTTETKEHIAKMHADGRLCSAINFALHP